MTSKSSQNCVVIGRRLVRWRSAGCLYATLREGTEYYKHVDEVMTSPSAWQGKSLQLHGFVVDKSIS